MESNETNTNHVSLSKEPMLASEMENNSSPEVYPDDEHSKDIIIEKTIVKLIQERQLILQNIQSFQQKLILFITKSSEKEYFANLNASEDAGPNTFKNLLGTIMNKTDDLKNVPTQSSDQIASLEREIEEKKGSLIELKTLFKESIEKTALNSVHSETGEHFTSKEVKELLVKEEEILQSLQEIHLNSIQKRHSLQLATEKKTNLAEGPLDFAEYEMMCIETQNNKEIIQPISEEIRSITTKASNIINVLSHLEQKLYLAQKEKNIALSKEKLLENELNKMRDELFSEKMKYTKMKHESKELQHKFILLQHPHLIEDYNAVEQEIKEACQELEKLKTTYANDMKIIKG